MQQAVPLLAPGPRVVSAHHARIAHHNRLYRGGWRGVAGRPRRCVRRWRGRWDPEWRDSPSPTCLVRGDCAVQIRGSMFCLCSEYLNRQRARARARIQTDLGSALTIYIPSAARICMGLEGWIQQWCTPEIQSAWGRPHKIRRGGRTRDKDFLPSIPQASLYTALHGGRRPQPRQPLWSSSGEAEACWKGSTGT